MVVVRCLRSQWTMTRLSKRDSALATQRTALPRWLRLAVSLNINPRISCAMPKLGTGVFTSLSGF